MTTIRRLTQLTTIVAILVSGVLLIVEIVGGIDSTWRDVLPMRSDRWPIRICPIGHLPYSGWRWDSPQSC